jgi:hypothetical protein
VAEVLDRTTCSILGQRCVAISKDLRGLPLHLRLQGQTTIRIVMTVAEASWLINIIVRSEHVLTSWSNVSPSSMSPTVSMNNAKHTLSILSDTYGPFATLDAWRERSVSGRRSTSDAFRNSQCQLQMSNTMDDMSNTLSQKCHEARCGLALPQSS